MEVGRKMKIAHVLKSSIYSGAENVVLTIMNGLKDQFDFIYIATEGPIREKLEEEGVPFLLLERFDRKNLGKALKKAAPDIVHAHDFSATVLCASLPGRFRLISHLHYDPPWTRKWNGKTLIYSICAFRVEKILAVSEQSFNHMVFSKIVLGKLVNVGNPVDVDRILRMAEMNMPDERIEACDNECDLIFVGRLVEQKNPQRFIRLVSSLKAQGFPEIKAWMLGDGDLKEDSLRMIDRLNLNHNIIVKGFKQNPYPYIKKSKVLCMTSRWEGFGLVLIEASILGVMVLSSRTAGAENVLGVDSDAIYDTDEEFIEKAKKILKDRSSNVKKEINHICAGTSIESYMVRLKELYQN